MNEVASTNLESIGKHRRESRRINTGKGSSGRTAAFTGKSKRRKRVSAKR